MEEIKIQDYIYEKEFKCPVCGKKFMDYAVRKSKLKYISSDIDLKANYDLIDPLLYEALLCQHCGYAALNMFFDKVLSRQADKILAKITPNFKQRNYSEKRTVQEAIERFKLALFSSIVKDAPDSEYGYICMKLAWLYRIAKDPDGELEFLEKAIQKFNQAYIAEDFPMCELDEETFSYMLAAFYKLTGKPEESLKWIGKVTVSRTANDRLKSRATDLKNEVMKEIKAQKEVR